MAEDKENELVLIEDDEDENEKQGQETEYVAVEKPSNEQDDDDDDDDEDDESSAKSNDGDDDDERAAIRERRRLEKKERKERQQKAIGRDKVELNFLRQRNDELERRMANLETNSHRASLGDIDRQIQEAVIEAETAERIIAKAVEAGNGDDVTKAIRYREQAVAKAQQLAQFKQQQQGQIQQRQVPSLDKAVEHYASEFMQTNSWYDPQGRDEDSAVVLAIDNKLAKEGYDPRTEEYWDELQTRIEKRLPEKFERQSKRKPTGGPAIGSGREHAPTSTRKEIYISPERKAAMIEAGVWDDPVLRQRYAKRYAQYDREHSNN
jgi:hypothetical protein